MIVELSKALEEFGCDSVRSGPYVTEEEMVRDAPERLGDEAPAPAADPSGAGRDDAGLREEVAREVLGGRRIAPRAISQIDRGQSPRREP